MSTEETETPETPKVNEGMTMLQLEQKIVRFNNLRSILLKNDQEWAIEHTEKRKALLEEAGILEAFLGLDSELKEHRDSIKANLDPITASITILSEYRMACVQKTSFDNMAALEKVWVFEEQIFAGLKQASEEANTDDETEDHIEEKSEENSEE